MPIAQLLDTLAIEPIVVLGIVLAALLYGVGLGYAVRHGLAPHHASWQTVAFYAGLLTMLLALNGPLDQLAHQLFWAHMLQHELLTLLVAPLLLLGAPLMPFWRVVPLGARREMLRWAMARVWPRRVGERVAHWLGQPRVSWVLFIAVFTVWHIPALYDLALTNSSVHGAEHLSFLGAALLFWAQIVPSRPLRRRMRYLPQLVYVAASAMAMNGLAALYMYSTAPLYPYYATLVRPAGTVSALVDQHIAGAVMDVPGTVLFFVAVCALMALWLRDDEHATDDPARPSSGRWSARPTSGAASGAAAGAAGGDS
ncbi:MAG TPA: cytochrome c oxidase assembly protein [Ktedonobacterales bacterium]|nr:cytochrome c oxidase assembly protein [Ktedonobacterales bacterium]